MLEDNSVLIFSMKRGEIENELLINDGEVEAVFIHPVMGQFVVLSSSGMAHIFSSATSVY